MKFGKLKLKNDFESHGLKAGDEVLGAVGINNDGSLHQATCYIGTQFLCLSSLDADLIEKLYPREAAKQPAEVIAQQVTVRTLLGDVKSFEIRGEF